MVKDYDMSDNELPVVGESMVAYTSNAQHRHTSQPHSQNGTDINRMRAFCKEHFDEAFVAEMEAKNFLVGAPQPTNESDFYDIDKMFDEAETSGHCTEEEVRMMFAV